VKKTHAANNRSSCKVVSFSAKLISEIYENSKIFTKSVVQTPMAAFKVKVCQQCFDFDLPSVDI